MCWAFICYFYVICFSNLIQMSFWHLCLRHSLARILSAPNQVVLVQDPELACTQTHEWKSIRYPLVNIYVTNGQSAFSIGKLLISTGPCSIANCLSLPGGSIWLAFCRRPTDEFRTLACRSNCQAAGGGNFEPLFTTSIENRISYRNSFCFASRNSTKSRFQVFPMVPSPAHDWSVNAGHIPSPSKPGREQKKHLKESSNKWFISSILNNSFWHAGNVSWQN